MQIFRRKRGQVTVELMLILPVFMLMIFFVLEYGNIAYRTIVLNHASYEFARIAALVGVDKPSGSANRTIMQQKVDQSKRKVFGRDAEKVSVQLKVETTGVDPMYKRHRHQDVIVTVTYPVKLAFPGTSYILADEPRRNGIRKLKATARMPVEKAYL
ncbi:MAG: pilus assembly protein, partial [Elusimicrobiaceae bacterium]|nr:pilus assembly protein [Elusimicrobiaceae bacterium]